MSVQNLHVQRLGHNICILGRIAAMDHHSEPQKWTIREQTVTDPVSGLTFEFTVSCDGEPHLTIYGDRLVFGNRTIVFHINGQAASGETAIPGRCETSVEGLNGFAMPIRLGRP
jgi:hypothetical protein